MPIVKMDKDVHIIFGYGDLITGSYGCTYANEDDKEIEAVGVRVTQNMKGPQPIDEPLQEENVERDSASIILTFKSDQDIDRMIDQLESMKGNL